jgi:hypothetical protein
MTLRFDVDGTATAIYDEMIDLAALGTAQIRRASHVEPTAYGQWTADMAPMAGPVLGPYPKRSEALAAEIAWLERALETGRVSA